jgi:type 1 fimbria pilin
MKRSTILIAILGLVLGGTVFADDAAKATGKEVTVQGTILCAKCTLHDEAMTECQNVLQVKEGDRVVNYYIVKNDVGKTLGDVCKGKKEAKIQGSVAEKDGRLWLTASKLDPVEES